MSVEIFKEMIGRTMKAAEQDENEIIFKAEDGHRFRFYHRQDCCECVSIDDICGDLEDLVGSPIVDAESVDGEIPKDKPGEYPAESCTWTFYRFATARGSVTVRWYGESNGYYSESVDYEHVGPGGKLLERR